MTDTATAVLDRRAEERLAPPPVHQFEPFPKIPRLRRDIIVTEKIDGTNACIAVTEDGDVFAQSRKRIITPVDDNFGFAAWVAANEHDLAVVLGPGRHFGEWWGPGIQRGYGLAEKRFSLFNVRRWRYTPEGRGGPMAPFSAVKIELAMVDGLDVVPVAAVGHWSDETINRGLGLLRETGSLASPGFMRPEGVVVFHAQSGSLFKVLLENDDVPKSVAE